MKGIKKLFGGIIITKKKLIIFAVAAGVYTALMSLLPFAKDTSFADISIKYEWWILFGLIIGMNSNNLKASVKNVFLFFLISQSLVYLIQVPFFYNGFGIFVYYKIRIKTMLIGSLIIGWIGYIIENSKWCKLIFSIPILVILGLHYYYYLVEAVFSFPYHLLSALLCFTCMIFYPIFILDSVTLKKAGLVISAAILIIVTVMAATGDKRTYKTTLISSSEGSGVFFNESYDVDISDEKIGDVYISYSPDIGCFVVDAEFKKAGTTTMIIASPSGEVKEFELIVRHLTFDLNPLN